MSAVKYQEQYSGTGQKYFTVISCNCWGTQIHKYTNTHTHTTHTHTHTQKHTHTHTTNTHNKHTHTHTHTHTHHTPHAHTRMAKAEYNLDALIIVILTVAQHPVA